jgi:hypothetical protein
MTIPYNASPQSIVNYIKVGFSLIKNTNYTEVADQDKKVCYIYQLKKDPSVIFEEREFQILRKALTKVIFVDYPKLTELLNYLKGIAMISNKLGIPIP